MCKTNQSHEKQKDWKRFLSIIANHFTAERSENVEFQSSGVMGVLI